MGARELLADGEQHTFWVYSTSPPGVDEYPYMAGFVMATSFDEAEELGQRMLDTSVHAWRRTATVVKVVLLDAPHRYEREDFEREEREAQA